MCEAETRIGLPTGLPQIHAITHDAYRKRRLAMSGLLNTTFWGKNAPVSFIPNNVASVVYDRYPCDKNSCGVRIRPDSINIE